VIVLRIHRGLGRLHMKGADYGPADYRLAVTREVPEGSILVEGDLFAPEGVLQAVAEAPELVKLALEGGKVVEFVVEGDVTGGRARILVCGTDHGL